MHKFIAAFFFIWFLWTKWNYSSDHWILIFANSFKTMEPKRYKKLYQNFWALPLLGINRMALARGYKGHLPIALFHHLDVHQPKLVCTLYAQL